MPLIKPEIQEILREAGLGSGRIGKSSIDENLDLAGLSNEALADELAGLALNSQNENLRLRAIETVLKVRGALKEQAAAPPSFTIVIQNSNPDLSNTGGMNPILVPRQSLGLKEDFKKEN